MVRIALILLLLVTVWAWDAATGQGAFFVHDLRHHHLPWRVWAAEEWGAGRIPMWAPEVANGFPLMAEGQTGVFYIPTILLFMVLPAGFALNAAILLHHWWAGLGVAWMLRRMGAGWSAALFAAVAFSFSGFLATHALYLGLLAAVSWLPWAIGALSPSKGESGRPCHWGLAGISMWMMLVAGHPQAAAFGMLTVGCWAVFVGALENDWEQRTRFWCVFSGVSALSIVAASPQLLAIQELVAFSMRDGGVGAAFAGVGSLPPQELLNGVMPRFFGFERPGDILETYHHRGGSYWGSGENHWEMAFYLGLPALGLALVRPPPQFRLIARFWWGVAIAATLLMLGEHTPAWAMLRHFPGLGGFRFPVRFSMTLTLAVVVLAGLGVAGVRKLEPAGLRAWARRWAMLALGWWGSVVLAGWVFRALEGRIHARLTLRYLARAKQGEMGPAPGLSPLMQAALSEPNPITESEIPAKVAGIMGHLMEATDPWSADLWRGVIVWLILAGLFAGLARFRQLSHGASTSVTGPAAHGRGMQESRAWKGWAFGLVGLLFVDLAIFGSGYQMTVPMETVSRSSALASQVTLEQGRWRTSVVDRRQHPDLDGELISSSLGLLAGTRDVIITSPLLMVRNEALLALAGLDVGDKGIEKVRRLANHRGIVDLLGVRWLMTVHDLADVGFSEVSRVQAENGETVRLYENETALPGAFLVGCHTIADDPISSFDGWDPRDSVILEETVEGVLPCKADRASTASEAAWGSVALEDRGPHEIAIQMEVTAGHPVWLVQNDTHYPGWEARLNGELVDIHRVNLNFRGVVVPPGKHELVFAYRPQRIHQALWVAPVAFMILAGWCVFGIMMHRRRDDEPGAE